MQRNPQALLNVKKSEHHITIPAGEQARAKCNIYRVVFEGKIPVEFESEPLENEDFIITQSILLTWRDIQNYITFQFSTGVTMT